MAGQLNLWFDHGLGDCVHFAHVLQLYKKRDYGVSVHYEANKELVWKGGGIPYRALENSAYHRWTYPRDFNQPRAETDYSGNKIASNLNTTPLPNIGDPGSLWLELCSVDLEGCVDPHIQSADIREALAFVRHLPRPIILLHTSGTNMAAAKNLPSQTVHELYVLLLDRCPGSLVLLDWDFRVPTFPHARIRHVKRDWGHISLYQLAALMNEAALLIGVDSGPYHFASLTRLPALGVFHNHYPSCVTLPRRRNVNMARAQGNRELNISRRPVWNLVEYPDPMPSARDIAHHAMRIVDGARYGLSIGRDVMLQQLIRDWCVSSTRTSPLADRNKTLDFLFQEIGRRFTDPAVVETGCIRSKEDWSAGYSTYLFGALLDGLGKGGLTSLDNNQANCAFARQAVGMWGERVRVECCDSVEWLRRTNARIDVLYLDSMDIEAANHAEHGLNELQAAESKLSEAALVVYDDSPWNGDWVGKGAKGVPYLLDKGWKMLSAGYQTVLSRV